MVRDQAPSDVVSRIRRFRDVAVQNSSAGVLEHWRRFLQEHETTSSHEYTHRLFDDYNDWWLASNPSYRLAIADDNAIDRLRKCIAEFWKLDIPLTLVEKKSPQIGFFQDLTIWGAVTETVRAEELITLKGGFLRLLGQTLGDVYPTSPFLDLVVFDATGVSKVKNVMKTSVRLVWPALTVDRERALSIRDYVVSKFKDSPDKEIRSMSSRILGYQRENEWDDVFHDEVYQSKHGVRMPLCDRVSPSPMILLEGRPFVPFKVVRFNFQDGRLEDVEPIAEKDELVPEDWVRLGSIRRDTGTELTEWTKPACDGPAPKRSAARQQETQGAGPAALAALAAGGVRNGIQARIRTHNGSDAGPAPRPRPSAHQAANNRQAQLEREFDGSVAEFKALLRRRSAGMTARSVMTKARSRGGRPAS